MIEPTETESLETFDAFAQAFVKILEEDGALLQQAPDTLPISRPDELEAAKYPLLRWKDH